MRKSKKRKVSKILDDMSLASLLSAIGAIIVFGIIAINNVGNEAVYMLWAIGCVICCMGSMIMINRLSCIARDYESNSEWALRIIAASRKELAVLKEFLELSGTLFNDEIKARGFIKKVRIGIDPESGTRCRSEVIMVNEKMSDFPPDTIRKAMENRRDELLETIEKEQKVIDNEPNIYAFFRKTMFIPSPSLSLILV